MKYVVVTGVSSGIGESIATELLENGYYVIGTVRKKDDSEKLCKAYPESFKYIICDLTQRKSIESACEEIISLLGEENLSALINNSGIATGGPIMHQPIEEIKNQFEVNLFGLITLSQQLLPKLGAELPQKNKPGRIINISSTNGKIAFPYIGAYSATKFALEAISDALRYELNIYGIKVIVIEPGIIKTNIWEKAEKADLSLYSETDYFQNINEFRDEFTKLGKEGLPPEKVSSIVRTAIESENPKTRYVITNKYLSEWLLPRILPDKYLDSLITKEVGLINKKNK